MLIEWMIEIVSEKDTSAVCRKATSLVEKRKCPGNLELNFSRVPRFSLTTGEENKLLKQNPFYKPNEASETSYSLQNAGSALEVKLTIARNPLCYVKNDSDISSRLSAKVLLIAGRNLQRQGLTQTQSETMPISKLFKLVSQRA